MDKTQKIWGKDDFFNFTNKPFVNIHMNAEVCRLPESGELSLVWNYNLSEPIGKIVNIRMVNREILGDVVFEESRREEFEKLFDDELVRLGGAYKGVEKETSLEGLEEVVTSCELYYVSVFPIEKTPGYMP